MMWKVDPVPGKPGLAQSKPGEFEGGIAKSWSLEKDGATLVLNVRKGVTFPSGKPVNAAVVKYLFDRGLQSPGYMRILFPRLLRITKPEQIEVRGRLHCRPQHAGAEPDDARHHVPDQQRTA